MTKSHRTPPLRYRGYYYDTETGFYYLQSRYYDPALGRFINADTYSTTDTQGFLSYNMFAYCENDPVNRIDSNGECLNTIAGAVAGGIIGAIDAYVVGKRMNNVNSTDIIAGFVSGMISGGIAGLGADLVIANPIVGIAVLSFTGAGGALLGDYAQYKINGKKPTRKEVVFNAVTSAALNVVSAGHSNQVKNALGLKSGSKVKYKAASTVSASARRVNAFYSFHSAFRFGIIQKAIYRIKVGKIRRPPKGLKYH